MLSLRYHSTNCFFLRSSATDGLFAVDAGWPCTLFEYARCMKGIGLHLGEIRWAMVTHFHMDHAGLVSDFLDRGITVYKFETQGEGIDAMERTILKNAGDYRRMAREKLVPATTGSSADLLRSLGVAGRVVVTDYHSPDSISLVTDQGEAIVGDLPPLAQMMPGDHRLMTNWDTLRAAGARTIFPSHAGTFPLPDKDAAGGR